MKANKKYVLVSENAKSISQGAKDIEKIFREKLKQYGFENSVSVSPTGSLGYEYLGVAVLILPDKVLYAPVRPEDIDKIVKMHLLNGQIVEDLEKPLSGDRIFISKPGELLALQERIVLKNVGLINPESIDEYIASGGYSAFERALEMGSRKVLEEVKNSGLRGRGGAGFPTGKKWEFTANSPGSEKFVVCNADEGEPGTYKDREIMEGDPHLLIEGMLISGFAVGAKKGYIYIRGEYGLSIKRISKAIEDAYKCGLLGNDILGTNFSFDIEVRKGAGAYICGEETALLESMEGKRGEPRKKPPYPPTFGLFGKPTVINNVETLANIPFIIKNGAEKFKTIGTKGSYGTKVFSLIGDTICKNAVEIPFGIPISYIVNELGGGVKKGRNLKAVVLGGVSGSLITPDEIDTPVDFNSLALIEAGPGSGSVLVLDDTRCIVDTAKNIAKFFMRESCGKCTPCRVGTEQMYKIIDRISKGRGREGDLELLEGLGNAMKLSSFCGLGQTAPNIILQSLKKFRKEWEIHVKDKRCPANVCSMNGEE